MQELNEIAVRATQQLLSAVTDLQAATKGLALYARIFSLCQNGSSLS